MRLMCISRHGGMCLAAVLLLSWTASLLGNWYMQGKVYAVEAGRTPQTLADLLAAEGMATLAAEALQRGDPIRGAVAFHTAYLTCTKCHAADEGLSPLGPNLTAPPVGAAGPLTGNALTAHLVESLLAPSQIIRPDYRTTTILKSDGQSISGIISRESPQGVVLRDALANGRETEIVASEIDERSTSSVSLMPAGLVNLLADRQQFLDLVRYLDEIARGGPQRAAALLPSASLLAPPVPAAYEREIDHAGLISDWADSGKAKAAFESGEKIYNRVCANCHGTLSAPGSLPTALRFAEGKSKLGADPHAMYRTLTVGGGQMVAQGWMVPSQKYDVVHYIRETFLKEKNPSEYVEVTPEYLKNLPVGTSRGPQPSTIELWRIHDYGPFLSGSIEVGNGKKGLNVASKGLAVRLDPGADGIGRGHMWILYELDTLRAAAIWDGENFIDWQGINFNGSHNTHPHIDGRVIASLDTMPGWADPATGSFEDPRPLGRDQKPYGPLPASHARFKALHHAGDAILLEYDLHGTRVLEMAKLEAGRPEGEQSSPVVTRVWSVKPHTSELFVRVASVGEEAKGDEKTRQTVAAIVGQQASKPTDSAARLEERDGFYTLVLPPCSEPLVVAIALAVGERDLDQATFAAFAATLPEPLDPQALVGTPARKLWDATIQTQLTQGADTGTFAIDVLAPPTVNPWNAQLRLGGIDFLGPDTAALCTWDGDVWTVSGLSQSKGLLKWRRIATGLYQPLGVKVIKGVIYITCRDRIVTLHDLDGDGLTDRYNTFNTDQQVTEHFHEFAMGLETDAEGNFYYAKSARHALPALVPHHGTLLKVTRDGSTTEIVANGFRAANGVCVEADGTFYVTDQEGHWNPKNRINHVRPGGFYGNMFGYHDVTDASDAAMDPPLAWITNTFDRSPAELLRVKSQAWQPLDGSLLELSYGEGRVHLVLPQEVRFAVAPKEQAISNPSRLQGGLVALPMPDLPTGIMRGRFNPADGQLYTCGLFAWAGNRTQPGGLFRIRRTSLPLRMPLELAATSAGLRLTFSDPLDAVKAVDPRAWHYKSWGLKRTANYGSNHVDEKDHSVTSVDISSDGRTATLHIEGFAPTWSYEVTWNTAAADGASLQGRLHGTIHVLQ